MTKNESTGTDGSCCRGGASCTSPSGPGEAVGGGRRVFWALGLGCVLAVPVGWVLATLILLPAFLGLFFYMLFGFGVKR